MIQRNGSRKVHRMSLKTFDRIACALLLFVFVFSAYVAVFTWEWFPVEGDWGEIAHIPPTPLSYFALLSPWVLLLGCLLIRRVWLKAPF